MYFFDVQARILTHPDQFGLCQKAKTRRHSETSAPSFSGSISAISG
jgi:hypothetical protein